MRVRVVAEKRKDAPWRVRDTEFAGKENQRNAAKYFIGLMVNHYQQGEYDEAFDMADFILKQDCPITTEERIDCHTLLATDGLRDDIHEQAKKAYELASTINNFDSERMDQIQDILIETAQVTDRRGDLTSTDIGRAELATIKNDRRARAAALALKRKEKQDKEGLVFEYEGFPKRTVEELQKRFGPDRVVAAPPRKK